MNDKSGHFEKGRWIEDSDTPDIAENIEEGTGAAPDLASNEKSGSEKTSGEESAGADYDDIDKIISDTAESVKSAVDSVINLGNAAIGTKQGRKEMEKKAKKAGKKFLKSIEDAFEDVKKSL